MEILPPPEDRSLWTLPAFALRRAWREGYGLRDLRRDAMAGVVVGIVALPLSMALAIGVGAPPQQGLYTAIVGGFVVAALGGSSVLVTGPTAAFIVILAPIYARGGLSGLLVAGMLAGLLLMLFGALRLGSIIQYIPFPVTTGFTAGIGTVIAILQLKDFLGLRVPHMPDQVLERVAAMFEARGTLSPWELAVGAFTLALLIGLPRVLRKIPGPLVALPAATLFALAVTHWLPGVTIATLANRFHTTIGGHVFDGVPQLPPLPMLPWNAGGAGFKLSLGSIRGLMPAAFAIAMLGAIESLLAAVVSDGMSQTKHDPDAELLALGIGNILCPFFGGIPATGAIARTATSVRSGARTPVAAMVHALTVLAAILILAPLLGLVPMASLAALLLLVAWNMSDVPLVFHTLRVAPRSDVAVLLTCYTLTVAFDMVIAVSVGVVLAALLFMRRMVEVTRGRLTTGARSQLPIPVPKGVLLYDIDGPLFFGAAQKAMAALQHITDIPRAVIFRLEDVPAMDATGLVALEAALGQLHRRGVRSYLVGLQPQPTAVVKKARLPEREGVVLCADIGEALRLAGA